VKIALNLCRLLSPDDDALSSLRIRYLVAANDRARVMPPGTAAATTTCYCSLFLLGGHPSRPGGRGGSPLVRTALAFVACVFVYFTACIAQLRIPAIPFWQGTRGIGGGSSYRRRAVDRKVVWIMSFGGSVRPVLLQA
jgi:hypothetical protein